MVSVSCVIFTVLANMSLITYIGEPVLNKVPLFDSFATEFLFLELALFLVTLAIYYFIPFAPLVMNLLILSNVMLLTLLKPYTVSSNYTVTVLGVSSIITWVLGLILNEYSHFSVNETNPTALLRSPGIWLEWSSMSIILATFIWKYATKIHIVFTVALIFIIAGVFTVVSGTGALLMACSILVGLFGINSFQVCFFAPPWKEKNNGKNGLIEPLINLFQNCILLVMSVWKSNSMCMVVGILSIGFFLVRAGATYFTEPATFVLYLSVLTLALLFWASSMS